MDFSIITPSYNQGRYIRDTLESVLSLQPNCSVEHIVIDGASQDETVSILKTYSEKYPNLIWSSCPDQGQSDAINKGLKLSKGEIVAYINSDDYYLPGTFKKVLDIFENNPDIDFVYGDIFLVNSNKRILKRVKSLRTSLWRVLYSCSFPQQSCFWRRSLLNVVPEFNVNNKTCMDTEYFANVLIHPTIFYRISEPLACFRVHEESLTWSRRMVDLYKLERSALERRFISHHYLPRPVLHFIGRSVKYFSILTRKKNELFSSQKL